MLLVKKTEKTKKHPPDAREVMCLKATGETKNLLIQKLPPVGIFGRQSSPHPVLSSKFVLSPMLLLVTGLTLAFIHL
jgi:hypothetical protein